MVTVTQAGFQKFVVLELPNFPHFALEQFTMPSTEIDAIFASKGKASVNDSLSSSSKAKGKGKGKAQMGQSASPASTSTATKSKKKKKKLAEGELRSEMKMERDDAPSATGSKRKLPEAETILDPSASISHPSKKKKSSKSEPVADKSGKLKKPKPVDAEEEERFFDSRGTGPRMRFSSFLDALAS